MNNAVATPVAEPSSSNSATLADRAIMRHFLQRPGFLLARVDQISTALFSDLCERVTLSQAEFLLLLDRLGPMIQIELAKAAGVDKSTTAYILDNMEDRGLIRRQVPEEDRRSLVISLTPAALALVPEVKAAFLALQDQLEGPLAPLNRPLVQRMLQRLGSDAAGTGPVWRAACDPPSGVLDTALSFLGRRGLQILHAQFVDKVGSHGLTLRQFSLLYLLSQRLSLTQTEFARLFGLDPATCGVIIRGAVRRGFLKGERCHEDRRARRYRITPQGRATLAAVHPLIDQSEQAVFACEEQHSRALLIAELQKIVHAHSHRLRYPGAI